MTDWKTIDIYFKNHPYYFTQHHINSYNDFLRKRIPKVLKSLNPITIYGSFDDSNKVAHEIKVYVVGVDGDQIYYQRPLHNGKPLYPNVARLQNLSYTLNVYVDITIEYTLNEVSKETKYFEKVLIGAIPIMLHSSGCILENRKSDDLIEMGECPYDQGGYFIIDGKEKILISQERIAPNQLFVTHTNNDKHIKLEGKIVSTAVNDVFPKTLRMFVMKNKNQDTFVINMIHFLTR